MSLFSKLLGEGKKEVASTLKKAWKDTLEGAEKLVEAGKEKESEEHKPIVNAPIPEAPEPEESGFSWGPVMPDEENQFNYPGPFTLYFENIFKEEFPEYEVTCEAPADRQAWIYTFCKDGEKKLVVELLGQSSAAYKIRRDCLRQGIPYLRYYYDHEGWWNTRAYVTQRTRAALNP